MNSRECASLALKIVGIYCFTQVIVLLSPLGAYLQMFFDPSFAREPLRNLLFLLSLLMPIALYVLAGICLIRFSDVWAQRWTSASTAQPAQSPASGSDLQAIAFSVLGVFLMVTALPRLSELGMHIASPQIYRPAGQIWRTAAPPLVGLTVQVLLGAGLFFGAGTLSAFWQRSRQVISKTP